MNPKYQTNRIQYACRTNDIALAARLTTVGSKFVTSGGAIYKPKAFSSVTNLKSNLRTWFAYYKNDVAEI